MKFPNAAIALLCCAHLVLAPAIATGQVSQSDGETGQWERVQSLAPGSRLQVRRIDQPLMEGGFVSADDATLVVRDKSGEVRIPRSAIRRIGVGRASARLKGAAIAGAIGAGAGVLIVVALRGALTDGDGVSEEAAAGLGAIGGAIGFGLGVLTPGYVTIYRVR